MKKSEKIKKADRLNSADREKYYVYTKLEVVKKAMIISAIAGAVVFVAGMILKHGITILVGAVFITAFAALAVAYAYIKSVWEKLLRESRKK